MAIEIPDSLLGSEAPRPQAGELPRIALSYHIVPPLTPPTRRGQGARSGQMRGFIGVHPTIVY